MPSSGPPHSRQDTALRPHASQPSTPGSSRCALEPRSSNRMGLPGRAVKICVAWMAGGAGAGSGDDGERDGGGLGSPATLCGGLQVARFSATYVRIMRELPAVAAEVLRGLQGCSTSACSPSTRFSRRAPKARCRVPAAECGDAPASLLAFARTAPPPTTLNRAVPRQHKNPTPRMLLARWARLNSPRMRSASSRLHGSLTAIHSRCYGESGAEDGGGELAAELRRVIATISVDRLREPLEAQPLFALAPTVVGMESLRLLGEAGLSRFPAAGGAVGSREQGAACAVP